MDELSGIQFPVAEDGRRSTTAVGRGVVADALRGVDLVGAGEAERETNWRTGYLPHFRRLLDASRGRPASEGSPPVKWLDARRRRMCVVKDGAELPLDRWSDR